MNGDWAGLLSDPRPGPGPDKELQIKAHAAAAAGGVGVNWIEDETVMLREYHAVRVKRSVRPMQRAPEHRLLRVRRDIHAA